MTEQQTDRGQPMTNHDRMNYWWRRATQADAELDSWMARAYEAEGKLWKAEARIRAVEDALDRYAYTGIYTGQERVAVSAIRRALDGA